MLIDTQAIDAACRDMMKRSTRLRQFALDAMKNQNMESSDSYEHEALGIDWCVKVLERAMNKKSTKKSESARLVAIR